MKKISFLCFILLLTSCANSKQEIIKKLESLDYKCEKNICHMDQWMTGVYDSFDFNKDSIWTTTIAQCDSLEYNGATFEINFNKDSLTIIDEEKTTTCTFNSKDKTITECSNEYEKAQLILDTLLTNLGQINLSYEDFK